MLARSDIPLRLVYVAYFTSAYGFEAKTKRPGPDTINYFCIEFQKAASDNCCCEAADSCTAADAEFPSVAAVCPVTSLRPAALLSEDMKGATCCTDEPGLTVLSVGKLPELARRVILAASASWLCCCWSLAQRASKLDAAGAFAMPAVTSKFPWHST